MIRLLETVEARWFLASGDSRLTTLQAAFSDVRAEAKRTDHYAPTTRPDLGIKARIEHGAAKLETKFLVASLGPRVLGPGGLGPEPPGVGVEGMLQRWSKVSVPCPSRELEAVRRDWRKVEKVRRVRRFAAGCNVELTQLLPDDAWTLALEAFGASGAELVQILVATAHSVFGGSWSTPLELPLSESYPQWLCRAVEAS